MNKFRIPKTDEFYIGYLPSSPKAISKFMQVTVMVIGCAIIGVSFLLAFYQRDFATSNFEYGVSTTLQGVLHKDPVPHVSVNMGKDIKGNSITKAFLLVGFGKQGVKELLVQKEKELDLKSLEAQHVEITGSLIYGDGKSLLQIDGTDAIGMLEKSNMQNSMLSYSTIGELTVSGEIVDPKCYFGVMKPGEGKPHRSCAIRCIAGGVPPVFKSDSWGYFLILTDGKDFFSDSILPIVGDHISITGEVATFDDWNIIKVNEDYLRNVVKLNQANKIRLAMETGISSCR